MELSRARRRSSSRASSARRSRSSSSSSPTSALPGASAAGTAWPSAARLAATPLPACAVRGRCTSSATDTATAAATSAANTISIWVSPPGARAPASSVPGGLPGAARHQYDLKSVARLEWRAQKQLYGPSRSEEHTSELQSHVNLVCRLLLEKKKKPIQRARSYQNILRFRSSHLILAC